MAKRLIETLCSYLRISGLIETAIKAARSGRETFYGWVRAVRQGSGTGLQRKLFAEVNPTEAESRLLQERMHISVDKSWRSAAGWLARKYPNEYGRRRPDPSSI